MSLSVTKILRTWVNSSPCPGTLVVGAWKRGIGDAPPGVVPVGASVSNRVRLIAATLANPLATAAAAAIVALIGESGVAVSWEAYARCAAKKVLIKVCAILNAFSRSNSCLVWSSRCP